MSPLLPFYYLCHINPQKIMDLLRYFYHPDHLGSSSWITDGSGNAIQHLHYLPFGEDWVDQRNSSWNTPYTFSGKEKDVETGYGYFGARYYDSGLSIWLSVDPMSDKYPSMSPYNYCANNPVILVDPDGREIWIQDINGSLYKYNNGQLFDQNGNEYQAEENSFVGKAKSSLDNLKSKPTGNKLISKLETEGKTTIRSSLKSEQYTNVSIDNTTQLETREEIIEWNSNGTTIPTDNAPWGSKNGTMDLGHEISHAYDAVSNHRNLGVTDDLNDREWLACYRENLMRGEFHQPLRTYYRSQKDNEGNIIFGLGPRLLRNGRPYLPSHIQDR